MKYCGRMACSKLSDPQDHSFGAIAHASRFRLLCRTVCAEVLSHKRSLRSAGSSKDDGRDKEGLGPDDARTSAPTTPCTAVSLHMLFV